MNPTPDYADIAARANASGIMVTAAAVEEIAGMLGARATPTRQADLGKSCPQLFAAFRTTLSGDGKYQMIFQFPTMLAMHAADDEWHRLRADIEGATLNGGLAQP